MRRGLYRGSRHAALADTADGGLAILKHTFDLSDDAVCERWIESPYFQYFCGEEFFCHELPLDRSSLTRWRQRMGEGASPAFCRRAWRWR